MGLSLIGGLMVAQPGPVEALHPVVDSFFELGPDAPNPTNIVGDEEPDQPDWAEIFDENGDETLPAGGQAATFIADDLATSGSVDRTTFSSSNKNNDPIESWNWATGNVPVKDDLSNVYAYAAKSSNGDLLIYAGLERLSPNGDSHIDIEFNQNEVTLDQLLEDPPTDTCGVDQTAGAGDGAPCEFVTEGGDKTENDFIVSLDYTKGGALGSLEVRRFMNGNYVHVFTLDGQGCNAEEDLQGPDNGDAICGFTNNGPINGGPWPNFDSKGAVTTADLPANSFAEFGINITKVLGDELCFATFGVHTRSSASFTAELKDFALGGFQVCQPDTALTVSAAVTYTFFETNTGSAPLTKPGGSLDFVSNKNSGGTSTCDDFAQKKVDGENVGDIDENGVLDPGETWQFTCTKTIGGTSGTSSATSTVVGTGHGLFNGTDTTFCTTLDPPVAFEQATIPDTQQTATPHCDQDEQRTVTVTIQ
jgi:hypothetical protein